MKYAVMFDCKSDAEQLEKIFKACGIRHVGFEIVENSVIERFLKAEQNLYSLIDELKAGKSQ